jgi:hypothetical protein
MHQFNNDVADRLTASGTPFGIAAGKAFSEQAHKDTLWDQILEAVGVQKDPYKDPTAGLVGNLGRNSPMPKAISDPIVLAQNNARATFEGGMQAVGRKTDDVKSATDRGAQSVSASTISGTSGTTGAVNSGTSRMVAAINGIHLEAPTVNVNIGPKSVTKAVNQQKRASGGSSRNPLAIPG